MRTEDLFKIGVTPKEGENAGKRYKVRTVKADGVTIGEWDSDESCGFLKNGEYELWKEPKTLFEDSSVRPTWGNLKKAMEASGLDDDTLFSVERGGFIMCDYCIPASFSIVMMREPYEKPKKVVLVK